VNLVNGMIVDGLGHVSLDSAPTVAAVNNIQPNIHQGKVEFYFFKDDISDFGCSYKFQWYLPILKGKSNIEFLGWKAISEQLS